MFIKHDFHIHTNLSRCANETATVENYFKTAEKLNLEKLGFVNHFWDDSIDGAIEWYKPQNYQHLNKIIPELKQIKNPNIETFFGCECEYDAIHHDVAITEEVAEKFDFIIVPNSHTHMVMPKEYYNSYEKHMNFMIKAYEDIINSRVSKYITAIAHPFQASSCPYDKEILIDMISDDCFKKLFSQTADKGIGIEVNIKMLPSVEQEIENCAQIRMFTIAKQCGCKFIFGSDAHNNKHHDNYHNADLIVKILELKERDILDISKHVV